MTKPSRIVKSAWTQAGKPGPLKSFARNHCFCDIWRANKKLLARSRAGNTNRARTSHNNVYFSQKMRQS